MKEFQWLNNHAYEYGFCQPYKMKGTERKFGYEDEPWHWSYFPISCKYTADYVKIVTYDELTGFLGAETAQPINVIEKYVKSVYHDCECK